MSAVLEFNQKLQTETCCKCGIVFAVPAYFRTKRLEDKESFWCPNGHPQAFIESKKDREIKALRAQLETAERERLWQAARAETVTRKLTAQKALVTKARKKLARVDRGVCTECHRSFVNVARHMESKHGIIGNEPPAGSKVRGE